MLKLRLSPIFLGSRITLGPAPWFRFERNVVRQGPTRDPVAELRNHQWNARGRHFVQLAADGTARVRFAESEGEATAAYGPFEDVHWSDGAMYAGTRLIAKFDDAAQAWVCIDTGMPWPVLLIEGDPEGGAT